MRQKQMTYTCEICNAVNAAVKLSCSCCGSIPRKYSWNGKTLRREIYNWTDVESNTERSYISGSLEVVRAHGAELQTRYRAAKRVMRTVPLDYYATE